MSDILNLINNLSFESAVVELRRGSVADGYETRKFVAKRDVAAGETVFVEEALLGVAVHTNTVVVSLGVLHGRNAAPLTDAVEFAGDKLPQLMVEHLAHAAPELFDDAGWLDDFGEAATQWPIDTIMQSPVLARQRRGHCRAFVARFLRVLQCNCFSLETPLAVSQCGIALHRWARVFNHACEPNLSHHLNVRTGRWHAVAIRAVRAGEELTISYAGAGITRPFGHTRHDFQCRCAWCATHPTRSVFLTGISHETRALIAPCGSAVFAAGADPLEPATRLLHAPDLLRAMVAVPVDAPVLFALLFRYMIAYAASAAAPDLGALDALMSRQARLAMVVLRSGMANKTATSSKFSLHVRAMHFLTAQIGFADMVVKLVHNGTAALQSHTMSTAAAMTGEHLIKACVIEPDAVLAGVSADLEQFVAALAQHNGLAGAVENQ